MSKDLLIAISWGLKEPEYSRSPLLPALNEVFPSDIDSLEDYVAKRHSEYGSEISFYWCYPLWVLAFHLKSSNVIVAGLGDFESSSVLPNLILQIDLPLEAYKFHHLCSAYSALPKILLVAESPLERHAQNSKPNLLAFDIVLTYNHQVINSLETASLSSLPFRFFRPSIYSTARNTPPNKRVHRCTYIGNAHSSGWRRNFQYSLGIRGFPVLWQYLLGWKIPLNSALLDEKYGAYNLRKSAVLAASKVFTADFLLSGRGWNSGGSGWLSRLFPDQRLKLPICDIGISPGSKILALCNSTFTLACENYTGNSGYVSEKLFDAMASGSIPIYIGCPGSLPNELKNIVVDLSSLPRHVLSSPSALAVVFQNILAMPQEDLLRHQMACLDYIDTHYESQFGLKRFLQVFETALQDLGFLCGY